MSIHSLAAMLSHAARIFASIRVVTENRTFRRRQVVITVLV
jgi:hypothetical protein